MSLCRLRATACGQRLAARDPLGLGLAHPVDQRAVAVGVGGILVGGQVGDPARDHLVEAGREAAVVGPEPSRGVASALDRRQVVRGAAAPLEGRLVQADRGAVELDRRAGSRPRRAGPGRCCQAQPSMNMLVAMASPMSVVARWLASRNQAASGADRVDDLVLHRLGRELGVAEAAEVAGARLLGDGAHELAGDRRVAVDHGAGAARAASWPATRRSTVTTMSQPITASASPAAMRGAQSWPGSAAMRTCDQTEPPFWARPAMSSAVTPLPSRWAAMHRMAPMVTTPVPPTPVIRMPQGSARPGRVGCGQGRQVGAAGQRPCPCAACRPRR